ncbi:hypothetical protein SISNIDRAFT_467941 [Sistotremastrum niveocremeum HHB9708]|uniref:Uncharacterized protein n=1 Tax=Sistotremastrum niveocremeum HHB9708 TaxID=1314777 RepID=A0A164RYY5_9AGAM|nr:hypothetical protein SISNIDRAFT_467941 [Sistotremastrum niveocremeum HHB9708]
MAAGDGSRISAAEVLRRNDWRTQSKCWGCRMSIGGSRTGTHVIVGLLNLNRGIGASWYRVTIDIDWVGELLNSVMDQRFDSLDYSVYAQRHRIGGYGYGWGWGWGLSISIWQRGSMAASGHRIMTWNSNLCLISVPVGMITERRVRLLGHVEGLQEVGLSEAID